MHLVCLGVTRRLLLCWLKGPFNVRIGTNTISELSNKLLCLIPNMPREFARKPRSLSEVMRWKATEFRQFLLYAGPLVLKNIYYQKRSITISFCSRLPLHYCLTIHCEQYCDYANDLLVTFVENVKVLYGDSMMVYNVHCLVHLANDVRIFGSLDNLQHFFLKML